MNRLSHHAIVWWDALLHPDRAAILILEPDRERGFTRVLALGVAVFYAAYGGSMGAFRGFLPAIVSALKLPFLYLLSLMICYPPLLVLNIMLGPRLRGKQTLRLLLFAMSANAVALASYAPLSFFFTLTTSRDGYSFLVLMHVAVFALAGIASMVVIVVMFRATAKQLKRKLNPLFLILWGTLYAFVGTQMAWTLRPWIGSWSAPWQPFRPIEGSFLESVWGLISQYI